MDDIKKEENLNSNNNEIKNEIIEDSANSQNKIHEKNQVEIIKEIKDEKEVLNEKIENKEKEKIEKPNVINEIINEEKTIEIVKIEENEKELMNEKENKKELIEKKLKEEIPDTNNDINIKEDKNEKNAENKINENMNMEKEGIENEINNIVIEKNEIKEENKIKDNENKNLDNKIMEKILNYTETNYKEFIIEKYFCDYNSGEEWRSGYISSISNENALIIDTINSDFSKKINLNDRQNISYFRKYSLPDNNMAKGTSKNLKNKLAQFSGFHKDFENYFKNCSNFDFYYFLRATLYYGLDFCMNPNINNENIYTSFKLILVIMDIIVDCLKFIEKNFEDFLSFESNIKNTDLADIVLLEKKFSIFAFYDDIHFLLKKIFGDSSSYLDWYIKFKNDINKFNPALNTKGNIDKSKYNIPIYKDETLEKICVKEIYDNPRHIFYTLDKEINSSIIAYFVDYFSHIDGFKILFKLIYSIKSINENNFKSILKLQKNLVDDLFLVKAITNGFNDSHQEEKNTLENYINNYINILEEKIFEKIGKNEFLPFFSKIYDLIEKDEDKKKIMEEKVLINYAFIKFIAEKKLDKRILYLTEINNIITSLEYNELSNKIFLSKKNNKNSQLNENVLNDPKFKDRNKEINKITSLEFCKICQEKNIINFILSNNSHEEIIKRLYPILKIMYKNLFGCKDNEIDKIRDLKGNLFKALFQRLKEVEKNNEVLWKAIQEIIINFTECLTNPDKLHIFLMIKSYFNESININGNKISKMNNIFNLVINFSLKSINKDKNQKENNLSEEKLYCLDMFLNLLLDKKKINELNINLTKEQKIDLINLSINGIKEIMKKIDYDENIINIIVAKIMEVIFSLINVTQNIILLEELNSKNVMFKESIDNFCSKKSDEEMINLINELTNIANSDKEDELYKFEYKLEKILDFIFLLFQSQKYIKKGYEKLNALNLIYSSNETIKKIFCEKLIKNLSLIKYEIKIYIFEKILTNPDSPFEIKNMQNYKLLKEFIINLNTLSNKFTYITENEFMVIFEKINDIFGYDYLFNLLLENENEEIQNDIQDLISDIYLGVKFSSREKYKFFWDGIVNSIVNKLKDLIQNNNDNKQGIKGIIGLFKTIIEKSNNDGEIIKNKQIL